ncbi:MAG: spermidine synthase, partial [Actinomycetota bacterium]
VVPRQVRCGGVGASGHQALFMVSEDPNAIDCDARWRPEGVAPAPVTDDYPFAYLAERGIPGFYLATIGLILLMSLVLVRVTSGPIRRMRRYIDLFFMGAAFLLLTTKNVVQFALLFGTTWFVNALVFAGVLLTVLAAIEVARRFEIRRVRLLWGLLFVSLAVAWAVPVSWLLSLPMGLRFVSAVAIAFAPVFLANLIFSRRFRGVGSSTIAFGANLLGSMVGGVLEYGALILGYRALLVVAAVFYALAFVFGRWPIGGSAPARAAGAQVPTDTGGGAPAEA